MLKMSVRLFRLISYKHTISLHFQQRQWKVSTEMKLKLAKKHIIHILEVPGFLHENE